MKLNQRGLLIVLSGPSGVGKGTVRKALFEMPEQEFVYSVSMTTRAPRPGEVDGVDYYFVSKEEFKRQIEKGNLLEHAEFVGNYYGTPKDKVEEKLASGHEVVLEIEVNGAMQVREKMQDAVVIECRLSPVNDMIIVFSNGVIFEQFMPASRKDEEWRIIDYKTDEHFVCYDIERNSFI